MTKKIVTKYIVIFLVSLVFAQVGVSIAYSNFGGTITELQEKAKAIALDNQRLVVQTAKVESLSNVASKAGELGFSQAQVIYLTGSAPLTAAQTSLDGKEN